MYKYIYIYMCIHVYIYECIYTYMCICNAFKTLNISDTWTWVVWDP